MSQKFAAKVLTFYEMGNTRFTEYLLYKRKPGFFTSTESERNYRDCVAKLQIKFGFCKFD